MAIKRIVDSMMNNALAQMVGFVLVACIVLVGCNRSNTPTLPNGTIIPLSEAFTGEFSLTDVEGKTQASRDYHGKASLIYFGFTNCPDICPAALSVMSAALNELGEDANQVQTLFIALDPEQDTPAVLKDYLAFDPRISGLTGSQDQIEAAKQGFKVSSRRVDHPESALGYTIEHSSLFYLTGTDGVPKYAIRDNLSPQQLAGFLRVETRK